MKLRSIKILAVALVLTIGITVYSEKKRSQVTSKNDDTHKTEMHAEKKVLYLPLILIIGIVF